MGNEKTLFGLGSAGSAGSSVFYSFGSGGEMYCQVGNTRIKVTEHFPKSGKTMGELIEDMILYAAGQGGQ